MSLYASFSRTPQRFAQAPLSFSWASEVLSTLISHFNPQSFETLGNGANTTAYTMTGASEKKQVLRLFPYYQLSHKKLSAQYRLTRSSVGGEWLSAKVSGKHLASNSHLIVWNPKDNTFKVVDQTQANALIDSRRSMKKGEELYVVGTVGDYVEGSRDLSHVLKEAKPMPEATASKITKKILKGIRELNAQGIVYRDLKPENVIMLPSGQIKLIDFGTAALYTGKSMRARGDVRIQPYESFGLDGKPRTGIKTDSYGVHLIAYQLLTGESYHQGAKSVSDLKVFHLRAHQREKATPLTISLAEDHNLDHVSAPMVQLLASLGTSFEDRRMTAVEALKHPALKKRELVQLKIAA